MLSDRHRTFYFLNVFQNYSEYFSQSIRKILKTLMFLSNRSNLYNKLSRILNTFKKYFIVSIFIWDILCTIEVYEFVMLT